MHWYFINMLLAGSMVNIVMEDFGTVPEETPGITKLTPEEDAERRLGNQAFFVFMMIVTGTRLAISILCN